jgi:hypothetical protein
MLINGSTIVDYPREAIISYIYSQGPTRKVIESISHSYFDRVPSPDGCITNDVSFVSPTPNVPRRPRELFPFFLWDFFAFKLIWIIFECLESPIQSKQILSHSVFLKADIGDLSHIA